VKPWCPCDPQPVGPESPDARSSLSGGLRRNFRRLGAAFRWFFVGSGLPSNPDDPWPCNPWPVSAKPDRPISNPNKTRSIVVNAGDFWCSGNRFPAAWRCDTGDFQWWLSGEAGVRFSGGFSLASKGNSLGKLLWVSCVLMWVIL